MRLKAMFSLIVVFLFMGQMLSQLGCGVRRQTEDFNMQGVGDLNLTTDNHPHGFKKTDCFICHLPQNIHQEDRLRAPNFSLAKPLVEAYGLSSCSGCHGTNGVAQ